MLDFVCVDLEVPAGDLSSDVQEAFGYQNTEFPGKEKVGKRDYIVTCC